MLEDALTENPYRKPATSNELVNLQTQMWSLHGASLRSCLAAVFDEGAKAQHLATLKEMMEWLEGDCREHGWHSPIPRRFCIHCWQALQREGQALKESMGKEK